MAVKINISNSACLKQQIQAIPQMLNLADKLKFFCVASFKCYKHFQLDYLVAEIFFDCLQNVCICVTCYECLLYQVKFKSSTDSCLLNKTLNYSFGMF